MKKAAKQNEISVAQDSRAHTDLFAKAMKVFHQGDYQRAGVLFEQAAAGPLIGVNESAQMYSRMCQQRMSRATVELKTPEDYYNYAVSLINARKFREARENLETAVAAGPQPHFCYALALVEGHLGSMDVAASHLRHAIQMDPALRGLARSDPDFAPLLHNPKLKEALASVQGTGG
jgi:tetratricopeptide (TPR) repeat protein